MTKKERIEYLESEVAGLHSKLAELIAKVEELEAKQVTTVQPLPYLPGTIINYWPTVYCVNCGQYYRLDTTHKCMPTQWWNPDKWVITYGPTCDTTLKP